MAVPVKNKLESGLPAGCHIHRRGLLPTDQNRFVQIHEKTGRGRETIATVSMAGQCQPKDVAGAILTLVRRRTGFSAFKRSVSGEIL